MKTRNSCRADCTSLAISCRMRRALVSSCGISVSSRDRLMFVATRCCTVESCSSRARRLRSSSCRDRSCVESCATSPCALATILDSNITTFIAAAVLFYIGTGPVRGFAVTLGIGIITTVFTAFTLTSQIVAGWVRWKRPKTVPI